MTGAPPTQTPVQLRRFGFILLANAAFLTVVIVGAALLSGRYLLFVLLLAVVANVYFASRQFAQARELTNGELSDDDPAKPEHGASDLVE